VTAGGDPGDAPVEVEAPAALVEQPREPAADVAEADEREVDPHHPPAGAGSASRNSPSSSSADPRYSGIGSEADAQVPVHLEVVAGHDEHAALLAQPLHQRGGIDRVRVPQQHDGAGVRRGMGHAPARLSIQRFTSG
jgi:hypothetical protein